MGIAESLKVAATSSIGAGADAGDLPGGSGDGGEDNVNSFSGRQIRELKKGHVFDGWSEGILRFPPTYKYEINSDKYHGEDPRPGRRTPAWCDRILSYGKGMRLLSYRRSELQLSDHRPVTATYMVEVEVFSARKLQRALTYTDAEIENEEVVTDIGTDSRMSRLMTEEVLLLHAAPTPPAF
nr:type IV inositol polyphosphate 5-phosphatase 3 isoform X1 [Ipomoea batatas]